jgi:hypothetical protein
MIMAEEKWYNSTFAKYAGIGTMIMLGFIGIGAGGCLDHYQRSEIHQMKINNRNLKLSEIENNPAVTEVDGEPILDFIRKH